MQVRGFCGDAQLVCCASDYERKASCASLSRKRSRVRRRLGESSAALEGDHADRIHSDRRALYPRPWLATAPCCLTKSKRTSRGARSASLSRCCLGFGSSSGRGGSAALVPMSPRIACWSDSTQDSTVRTATRNTRLGGGVRPLSQSPRKTKGHSSRSRSVRSKTPWRWDICTKLLIFARRYPRPPRWSAGDTSIGPGNSASSRRPTASLSGSSVASAQYLTAIVSTGQARPLCLAGSWAEPLRQRSARRPTLLSLPCSTCGLGFLQGMVPATRRPVRQSLRC
jgi:hypothetical protein